MKLVWCHICIFLASVILFGIVDVANSANNKLDTPERAVEQALIYSGFEERLQDKSTIKDAASIAHKVLIKSDSTPFLWGQIEGREMWVIKFVDVDIRNEYKVSMGATPEYRNFAVVLDPEYGWLVRIYSDPVMERPDIPAKVSGEVAGKMIHSGCGEVWHEFPDSLSGINFIQALNASPACFPNIANEITGYYLIF